MKNGGSTHGGSIGKSFGLLFRALFNILAFTALWFGVWLARNGGSHAVPWIVGGGILCLIGLVWNFFGPIVHTKR